jgi:hypothetical protein
MVNKPIGMRWAGHLARMGTECIECILVRKSEEKKSLGKLRSRWKHNIKINVVHRM